MLCGGQELGTDTVTHWREGWLLIFTGKFIFLGLLLFTGKFVVLGLLIFTGKFVVLDLFSGTKSIIQIVDAQMFFGGGAKWI